MVDEGHELGVRLSQLVKTGPLSQGSVRACSFRCTELENPRPQVPVKQKSRDH